MNAAIAYPPRSCSTPPSSALPDPEQLYNTAYADFSKGKVDDVHEVMLAMTRADLSFRMVLEVRNKLVEAYQEVMRLNV